MANGENETGTTSDFDEEESGTSTTEGGNNDNTETLDEDEQAAADAANATAEAQAGAFRLGLTLKNLQSGKTINILGSIESYSDSFSVKTTSDAAYGRIDPIMTYTGTERTISFSIKLDGETLQDFLAPTLTDYVRHVVQALYPTYSDPLGPGLDTSTLKAPPLVYIQYKHLLDNIGYITSFSYDIDTERGVLSRLDSTNSLFNEPAGINMSFTFTPLHTKEGGHGPSGNSKNANWPY